MKPPSRQTTKQQRENLLLALLAENKACSCSTLAERLECDERTVIRYVRELRREGAPIGLDGRRNRSYYLKHKLFSLPSIRITEEQIQALYFAAAALQQYRALPFYRNLKDLWNQISGGLGNKMGVGVQRVEKVVSFQTMGLGKMDDKLFGTLLKASLGCYEVLFKYPTRETREIKVRRVQPYHLTCKDGLFYLVGREVPDQREGFKLFALPRIHEGKVIMTSKGFVPKKFHREDFFGGSIGPFHGKERHKIRIKISGKSVFRVMERQWDKAQQFIEHDDGCILEMQQNNLRDVFSWVMKQGADAEVIEPAKLRQMVIQELDHMARIYRGDGLSSKTVVRQNLS
ncbi:MAG: WYL domain-containing protein [Opitutaceae bacterium]|jgi:predicted DNA-binding transcriptional regulator YafY